MKKILVVDDEPNLRKAIALTLEEEEYEVFEADNGASAFDIAAVESPDLIISDVMMDNGNGFMLRELLRSDERTASIKVIMMTGAAEEAGAWQSDPEDNYLLKPFTADDMLSEIGRVLDGKHLDRR